MNPTLVAPPGLLSAFGVKIGGQLPQWADGIFYQPVIEMLEWALQDPNACTVSTAFASSGVGVGTYVILYPANPKAIWLFDYSLSSAAIGAGSLGIATAAQFSNVAAGAFMIGPQGTTTSTAGQASWATKRERPIFLPPNSSIGFLTTINSLAAGVNVTGAIRYVAFNM